MIIGSISILFLILYLNTLREALERCDAKSRTISPNSVWWMFCPFVNLVFHFVLVANVAKSMENEFARREVPLTPLPPKLFGTATCVFSGAAFLFALIPGVPSLFARSMSTAVALLLWVMYWQKIDTCSSRIAIPFPTPRDTASLA